MLSFRDTGWTELYIPLESIQPSCIQFQDHPRPKQILYKDAALQLDTLPILTPFYTVLSWDFTVGKLECLLSVGYTQLHSIQEQLGKDRLQQFFYEDRLCVYLDSIHLWRYDTQWVQGYTETSFPVGSRIRVGFRIYPCTTSSKPYLCKVTCIYHEFTT